MGRKIFSRRFALIAVVSYFVFQEAAGQGLSRATSQQSLRQFQRNNPFFPIQRQPTTTARPIARRRFPLNTRPVTTTATPSLRRPQFPAKDKPGVGTPQFYYLGSTAPVGAYPFVVYLEFANLELDMCAGTLLSEDWVLTAAHCVIRKAPTKILLGTNTRIRPFPESVQERTMQRKCCHKGYDETTLEHDICLIKLSSPVGMDGTYIRSARLPDGNSMVPDGTTVIGMGWGLKEDGKLAEKLQHGEVQVVNKQQCINWYAQDGGSIPDNHLCAGGGKTDSCAGDSGGPLVTKESNGEFVLRGVASFGPYQDCGVPERPGVYTAVSRYVPWIKTKMSRPCNEYQWSTWKSTCLVTCGIGTEEQTRNCMDERNDVVPPSFCPPGISKRSQTCFRGTCPTPTPTQSQSSGLSSKYQWSTWKSTCLVTCGIGTEEHTRDCMDERNNVVPPSFCPSGISKRRQTCFRGTCPAPTLPPSQTSGLTSKYKWSTWKGTCLVTCGIGTEEQTRNCIDERNNVVTPSFCPPGISKRSQTCFRGTCPTTTLTPSQTSGLTSNYQWSTWKSTCLVTCGIGTEEQTRNCTDQRNNVVPPSFCPPGISKRSQTCYRGTCPTPIPTLSQPSGLTSKYQWSTWKSTCLVTCGVGTEEQTRDCMDERNNVVPPSFCPSGISKRRQTCFRGTCPGPTFPPSQTSGLTSKYKWSNWKGTCLVTCGIGTEEQTRNCIDERNNEVTPSFCPPGNSKRSQACYRGTCPTTTPTPSQTRGLTSNYQWSTWKSTCLVTCGIGTEEHTRNCIDERNNMVAPSFCPPGISKRSQTCYRGPCPTPTPTLSQPSGLTSKYQWSTWKSTCLVTCGIGTEEHTRNCIDERNNIVAPSFCPPGISKRSQACFRGTCPTTIPTPSQTSGLTSKYQWSTWKITCLVTCGIGTEEQTRNCMDERNKVVSPSFCLSGISKRSQTCFRGPCPTLTSIPSQTSALISEYQWSNWKSTCLVTCGIGTEERTRNCMDERNNVVPPSFCPPGISKRRRTCYRGTCPTTTPRLTSGLTSNYQWSSWKSTCLVTCGIGIEEQTRNCIDERNNVVPPSLCPPGNSKRRQTCYRGTCASPTPILNQTRGFTSKYLWSNWKITCLVTCGIGTEEQKRDCMDERNNVVSPSFCSPGISKRRQTCNRGTCPTPTPTPGQTSGLTSKYQWSIWKSTCLVTCGIGTEEQTRDCMDERNNVVPPSFCPSGISKRSQTCYRGTCPTPTPSQTIALTSRYQWSNWKSTCLVTCGIGTEERTRNCMDERNNVVPPSLCPPGIFKKRRTCYRGTCPTLTPTPSQTIGLTSKYLWSTWKSTCLVTCGIGTEEQTRNCMDERNNVKPPSFCPGGISKRSRACYRGTCPTPNPSPSQTSGLTSKYQWSTWKSTCSVTCGIGAEEQTRNCMDERNNVVTPTFCPPGISKRSKTCYRGTCPTLTPTPSQTIGLTSKYQWSSWKSSCLVTCGIGTEEQTRKCMDERNNVVPPSFCPPGISIRSKTCHRGNCPSSTPRRTSGLTSKYKWSPWKVFCTVTCGQGSEVKSRQCLASTGQRVNPSKCQGGAVRIGTCIKLPCQGRIPLQWSPWGSWSTCRAGSQLYNACDGFRSATRDCLNFWRDVVAPYWCNTIVGGGYYKEESCKAFGC